jgi:hypothetical protein
MASVPCYYRQWVTAYTASIASNQVDQLREDGRIDMYAEADYSEGTTAYMWLMEHVNSIASSIYQSHEEQIRKSVSQPPGHLTE